MRTNGIRTAALAATAALALIAAGCSGDDDGPDAAAATAASIAWNLAGPEPKPCARIRLDRYPEVDGGCLTVAQGDRIQLEGSGSGTSFLTVCRIGYVLRVGPAGDSYMENVEIQPLGPGDYCRRLLPCARTTDVRRELPWKGRIEQGAGERFEWVTNICLETPSNFRVKGPFRMALDRTDTGWKATARFARAGDSGLEVTGEWTIRTNELDLR